VWLDREQFKNFIREQRTNYMDNSLLVVEHSFINKGFNKKNKEYFLSNATEYVYEMREAVWQEFLLIEKHFTAKMAEALVGGSNRGLNKLKKHLSTSRLSDNEKVKKIIYDFIKIFGDNIYDLNLSNTQSRRSRAGNEFEYIIYKLLIHSKIFNDDQGILGNERFREAGLGKLVDCVVPGVMEYDIEKHKCALISMKTTLRERWAEVPEELSRTGAQSMYLLTLDESISDDKINTIYSHNVHLVVPDDEKKHKYAGNPKVYGLTDFIQELNDIMRYWNRKSPSQLGRDFFEDKVNLYLDRMDRTSMGSEKRIYREYIDLFRRALGKI
jgi:hypothetical protein